AHTGDRLRVLQNIRVVLEKPNVMIAEENLIRIGDDGSELKIIQRHIEVIVHDELAELRPRPRRKTALVINEVIVSECDSKVVLFQIGTTNRAGGNLTRAESVFDQIDCHVG